MINQEITTKDFEATRHHFETEILAQWWGINGHEFWNWDYMDEKFPNGLVKDYVGCRHSLDSRTLRMRMN